MDDNATPPNTDRELDTLRERARTIVDEWIRQYRAPVLPVTVVARGRDVTPWR